MKKNVKETMRDNSGFSLVELIIVIGIMAVLVGLLSPQYIKYVEQARRATDIQNADSIRTSILADIADGTLTASTTGKVVFSNKTDKTTSDGVTTYNAIGATTIATAPKIKGNLVGNGEGFYVTFDVLTGDCHVYACKVSDGKAADTATTDYYDLTDEKQAQYYKQGLDNAGAEIKS